MNVAKASYEFPDSFLPELPSAPYPGLRPFEKREWPIFFGRERMTDDVIARVFDRHLVIIHGRSGDGKSSLVRAGVLVRLEQSHARSGLNWRTCVAHPGNDPLGNLADALAEVAEYSSGPASIDFRRALNRGADSVEAVNALLRIGSGDRVCILLDQFEELFAFAKGGHPEEAGLLANFVVSLLEQRPAHMYLIATMRSDYLGDCGQFDGLAEAVNLSQYLLPRMEIADLLRAIREPAALYGAHVTGRLAAWLIADARRGDDELPLVQHGLARLWRGSRASAVEGERVVIDIDDYNRVGPLAKMLSDHANQVFKTAAPDDVDKKVVEELFRALTDINSDGAAVRRRLTFAQLLEVCGTTPTRLTEILDAFRREEESFLRPYSPEPIRESTVVEVGHEALIRRWDRIAGVIDSAGNKEQGWLQKEFRDGLIWKTLSLQAETFARDSKSLLSLPAAELQEQWLHGRNSAWSQRYGGNWEQVISLVEASRQHGIGIRRRNAWIAGAILGAVLLALMAFAYVLYQNGVIQRMFSTQQELAQKIGTLEAEKTKLSAELSDARHQLAQTHVVGPFPIPTPNKNNRVDVSIYAILAVIAAFVFGSIGFINGNHRQPRAPPSPFSDSSSGETIVGTNLQDSPKSPVNTVLADPVGRWGTQAIGLYFVGLAATTFYILIWTWPVVDPRNHAQFADFSLFGWQPREALSSDIRLFMTIVASGALGSLIHCVTSFADYVGNRSLTRSWIWWLLLRTPIGIALALMIYIILRGALIVPVLPSGDASSQSVDILNPYGLAAIAAMAGMFSKQATDKLREIFDTLFRTSEPVKREDPLDLSQPKNANAGSDH